MVTVESISARLEQLVAHVDGINTRVTAVENEAGIQANIINPIRTELTQLKNFMDQNAVGAFRAEVEAMKIEISKKPENKTKYDYKYGRNFQIQKFNGELMCNMRFWKALDF